MHKNVKPVWVYTAVAFSLGIGLGIGSGWAEGPWIGIVAGAIASVLMLIGYHMGVSDAHDSLRKEREGQ